MFSHHFMKGNNLHDFLFASWMTELFEKESHLRTLLLEELILSFNPIALRKAKIACNFGLSECNRVKG